MLPVCRSSPVSTHTSSIPIRSMCVGRWRRAPCPSARVPSCSTSARIWAVVQCGQNSPACCRIFVSPLARSTWMRADSPGVESYSQRTPTDDVERELMRAVKRLLDATVAAVALVVLLPVLAAVGLAIRLRMGSPILFRQVRPGLHGAPFTLVKFRTMRPARAGEEELATDARRLTGLGRFLRRDRKSVV